MLKARRASTLIEFLVSVGLLGLCGVGFLTLTSNLTRLQQRAEEQAHAQALARTVLEEALRKGGQTTTFPDLGSIPSSASGRFVYKQDVVELETGLKKVSVSVSRPGGPLLVSLGCLVSQP